MTRRGDHRTSARIAGLQKLATTLSREELGRAHQQTDAQSDAMRLTLEQNCLAVLAVEEVFAQEHLCLDRLALAGMSLEASEAQLVTSRAALEQARQGEASASTSYAEAEQRLRWISSRARDQRRKHLEKREEQAMSEVALLRNCVRARS